MTLDLDRLEKDLRRVSELAFTLEYESFVLSGDQLSELVKRARVLERLIAWAEGLSSDTVIDGRDVGKKFVSLTAEEERRG